MIVLVAIFQLALLVMAYIFMASLLYRVVFLPVAKAWDLNDEEFGAMCATIFWPITLFVLALSVGPVKLGQLVPKWVERLVHKAKVRRARGEAKEEVVEQLIEVFKDPKPAPLPPSRADLTSKYRTALLARDSVRVDRLRILIQLVDAGQATQQDYDDLLR